MSARTAHRVAWGILALTWLGTLIAFPFLPSQIATHWDAAGNVNGTMNTFLGAFLMPLIMLGILILFLIIPRIDPLRVNIELFRDEYNTFIALLMFVLAAIHASLVAYNLGYQFDVTDVVLPAVGLLMFYVGTILPKTKRNWFIGIRTPWTISSDYVWQKTHELGGTLFKVLGALILFSVLVPQYALVIALVPLCVFVLGLILYSYRLYDRHHLDLNDVS